MNLENLYVFDCEVFKYDWFFVFKNYQTKERIKIHNDYQKIKKFMNLNPLLCGFNNKHYDQFILKTVLADGSCQKIKEVNDYIIEQGNEGYNHPFIRANPYKLRQFDLMDDMAQGLSLKSIEAHLGMDIEETEVDFNMDRPLTEEEIEQTFKYCSYDVDSTEKVLDLRENYLETKITLGEEKGISAEEALYMTNAKLTAVYLDAKKVSFDDERQYVFPKNILYEYIPNEVIAFFKRIHNSAVSNEELFHSKYEYKIGDCDVTIAFGGIHGAIPQYREKATSTRTIRNQDVSSYYPHLMTIDGYLSRAIENPKTYEDMLARRIEAKKSGNKKVANALKLVANTTYGAELNQYNDLYDAKNARSVCITGQLRLCELAHHLINDCKSAKIIQLNTDGIMLSIDDCDVDKYKIIVQEWQDRTGFELEEDCISEIIQKDVNNYIEVKEDGSAKTKGGYLVRGLSKAGAFNVNNQMTIISKAIIDFFVKGISAEDTINNCNDLSQFQIISHISGKYSNCYQLINGNKVDVQKTNRVYATNRLKYGSIYKIHSDKKNEALVPNLPNHCLIDNNNHLTIEDIDKNWYIEKCKSMINDFIPQQEGEIEDLFGFTPSKSIKVETNKISVNFNPLFM